MLAVSGLGVAKDKMRYTSPPCLSSPAQPLNERRTIFEYLIAIYGILSANPYPYPYPWLNSSLFVYLQSLGVLEVSAR